MYILHPFRMKFFLSITALLMLSFSYGQSDAGKISGHIADEKGSVVEGATIGLTKANDSMVIKTTLSDASGNYTFTNIPFGEYFITASATNKATVFTPTFLLQQNLSALELKAIVLVKSTQNLNTVTIVSKKPFVEQKIDRMVVNVEASVTNVGSTALEVLEKSPGVTIDKDGNISLKGKPKVMIMIDDKPSYLSGAELANLLSSMNANQLSQIEIMTNPSAKFDAAGNAGVINIKTKKGLTKGFNGNITLNYGQGVYYKTNNSILLNYRNGKFNTFFNWGYSSNKGFMQVDALKNFLDPVGTNSYVLDQHTHVINNSQNDNFKIGMDYALSEKSSIGVSSTGFITPSSQKTFTNSIIKEEDGNIGSIEKTNRAVSNTWKNGTLNLNFQSTFDSSRKNLMANFDYLHYDFAGTQEMNGNTYDPANQLLAVSYLKNMVPLQIDVYAGKLDYAVNLPKETKLEIGGKSSLVKTGNTALFYIGSASATKFADSLSNDFNYSENINAAYININKKIKAWTIQAGLRAEHTQYHGHQVSYDHLQDSSFNKNYVSLFPTAFVGYKVNDNHQLTFSVGRRIDRPAYQQLNPFTSFIDRYMQVAGNPFLQPQVSGNFEISHTYKNKFTTTINYSVIHRMMNETLIQKDSLIIRSMGNIGTRYNIGIAESINLNVTPWYALSFFANLFQNKYDGQVNGAPLKVQQLTLSLNMNNQFNFKKGWSGEISGNYATRNRDEGQAIDLAVGQLSAGISKQVLHNKGSIKLNMRDIFFTQINKEYQVFQNVNSNLSRTRDTRVLNLAFVYRFGNPSKSKNIQPTEEQKRIQIN